MNLYREVKIDEIYEEINSEFSNNLIRSYEERELMENIILNCSRSQAKKEISKNFKGKNISHEFYTRVKKLYKAIDEIQKKRKIYTEL